MCSRVTIWDRSKPAERGWECHWMSSACLTESPTLVSQHHHTAPHAKTKQKLTHGGAVWFSGRKKDWFDRKERLRVAGGYDICNCIDSQVKNRPTTDVNSEWEVRINDDELQSVWSGGGDDWLCYDGNETQVQVWLRTWVWCCVCLERISSGLTCFTIKSDGIGWKSLKKKRV